MKPVDDSIFTYHAATFPEELRGSTSSIPGNMLRALEEARKVLDQFSAFRAATIADKRLSPTGKREALREWVEQNLPALRTRVEDVGAKAAANEARVIKEVLSNVLERPAEVADAMVAQEIRAHFRAMPSDTARSDALRRMAGDRSVLQALLGAPAFLSGVSEDELEQVRIEAARSADPDRWAKMETMRRGWAATEKAVAAAVRAVDQAMTEPEQASRGDRNLPPPDPENAARVLEAIRRSGGDPVAVDPDTNRERVAAALGVSVIDPEENKRRVEAALDQSEEAA